MTLQFFSKKTNKFYKLVQTETWPTVLISGIRMHRTDGIDPKKDSIIKVKSLGKLYGNVLDTCTGLGYTAIMSAKSNLVKHVITCENDVNMLFIARQNPYSRELFENEKISLILYNSFDFVKSTKSNFFNFVIHDPPRFSLSPELYSQEFYNNLFRIMKRRSKLFHYVGSPGSKQGKNYTKGISKRLKLAGFKKIKIVDEARGLLAFKF